MAYESMKKQYFGIEIELTGITREKAADVIARYFGTRSRHVGGSYDPYTLPRPFLIPEYSIDLGFLSCCVYIIAYMSPCIETELCTTMGLCICKFCTWTYVRSCGIIIL